MNILWTTFSTVPPFISILSPSIGSLLLTPKTWASFLVKFFSLSFLSDWTSFAKPSTEPDDFSTELCSSFSSTTTSSETDNIVSSPTSLVTLSAAATNEVVKIIKTSIKMKNNFRLLCIIFLIYNKFL